MEFNKECARIGKEFIRLCAVPADANKQIVEVPTIDTSRCAENNCPVYKNAVKKAVQTLKSYGKKYRTKEDREEVLVKLLQEELNNTCVSLHSKNLVPHCEKGSIVMQQKIKYDYEYMVSIGRPRKLSKTQIQLALVYHFLADNNGFVTRVDERDLASKLKCDIKTVKAATEALKDMGIIAHSYLGDYQQVIAITDYKKYHASAKNGGLGYIYMAPTMLDALLACKDVNSLRANLRMLLIDDTTNMHIDNENKKSLVDGSEQIIERRNSIVSINDARRFLPKYFSISKLTNTFAAAKTAFETVITGNGVEFKLKEAYNGKIQVAETVVAATTAVKELVNHFDFDLSAKEIVDSAKLAIEFSMDLVKEGFENISKTISNEIATKTETVAELCVKYNDMLEQKYTEEANAIFSEIVALQMGHISIEEAVLLIEKHPEVIVKGKSAIDNFGGYLRTVIQGILCKHRVPIAIN